MNLKIEIKRNSDGVIAIFHWNVDDVDAQLYLWEEGNYSCDCNRDLFFNDVTDNEAECGNTRYSVRLIDADSGEMLYDEWDEI